MCLRSLICAVVLHAVPFEGGTWDMLFLEPSSHAISYASEHGVPLVKCALTVSGAVPDVGVMKGMFDEVEDWSCNVPTLEEATDTVGGIVFAVEELSDVFDDELLVDVLVKDFSKASILEVSVVLVEPGEVTPGW